MDKKNKSSNQVGLIIIAISVSLALIIGLGINKPLVIGSPLNDDGELITNVNSINDTLTFTVENLFENCVDNSYGDDCYIVRKFGESAEIGTTVTPISNGNIYQTPTTLTTLEIVSDDSEDNINGIGAHSIKVTGLSVDWEEVTEIVELNGTTPVQLQNQFYRVYRVAIYESGTYATQDEGSHQGNIELIGVTNSELWAQITINGVALGQTEIGVYTIPKGYHAHLGSMFIHNNGVKSSNVYMFIRNNASNVISPYDPMRIQFQIHGLTGGEKIVPKSISGGMSETSDIGFMANTDVGSTEVSVDFEILLIKIDH